MTFAEVSCQTWATPWAVKFESATVAGVLPESTLLITMEVGCVFGNLRQRVVDLIVKRHRFRIDVLHRDPAGFAERHFPIRVEGAAWIHANCQRSKRGELAPTRGKEVTDRRFHRRMRLTIPVHPQDRIAPIARGSHPDVLKGT